MATRFTPTGFIILQVFSYIMILTIFIVRLLIFWNRSHTLAFKLTTLSHMIFTLTSLGVITGCSYFSTAQQRASDSVDNMSSIDEIIFTPSFAKRLFAGGIMYTTAVWALKFSFLGYFYEFKRHLSDNLRRFLRITLFFVSITYSVLFVLHWTLCRPIQSSWVFNPERCDPIQQTPGQQIHLSFNLATDLMLIAIPILTLRSLNLPRPEQCAIAIIVLIGAIVPLVALLRFLVTFETVIHTDPQKRITLIRTFMSCAMLEVLFADVAFFLPSLRVYYRRARKEGFLLRFTRPIVATLPSPNGSSKIQVTREITVRFRDREGSASDAELATWKPEWDESEPATAEAVREADPELPQPPPEGEVHELEATSHARHEFWMAK